MSSLSSSITARPLLRLADRHPALVMVTPALLVIFAVVLYPLGYAVWVSLHGARLGDLSGGSIGIDTYGDVLGDHRFWRSISVSAVFLVVAVAIELVLGMALALLFSQPAPGMAFLRGILILPVLLSPVIIGILWKLLLNQEFGVVNKALRAIGLPAAPWLTDPTWAKGSIVLMDVWQWTPFMALLLAAGLHSLPEEVLEAAHVDGARPVYRFRTIVVPLLARVIFVALAFRLVFALSTFATVYVLTQGGPDLATDLFSLFIHREGLRNFNTSYAAAASLVVLLMALTSFAVAFRSPLRKWEG